MIRLIFLNAKAAINSVSYTHLDVYKRQILYGVILLVNYCMNYLDNYPETKLDHGIYLDFKLLALRKIDVYKRQNTCCMIVTRIPTAAILKIRLTSILVSPFYHSKIRRKAAAQKLSTRHSLHSFPSFVIRFSYSCESCFASKKSCSFTIPLSNKRKSDAQ